MSIVIDKETKILYHRPCKVVLHPEIGALLNLKQTAVFDPELRWIVTKFECPACHKVWEITKVNGRNYMNNWKEIKKARRGSVSPFRTWATGVGAGALGVGIMWVLTWLFWEAF